MLNRIMLTTDAIGGVWRYSMELARGLAAQRIGVVLVVLGPQPDTAQTREAVGIPGLRLLVPGLPLDWLAETPEQIEASAQALASLAQQVAADSVQLHAPALVGFAAWPIPVVAVAHSCVTTWWRAVRGGPMPRDLAWKSRATALGLAGADLIVAPSASFAKSLRDCYDISGPIKVVCNGRTPLGNVVARQEQALTVGRLWDAGKNVAILDVAVASVDVPVYAAGPTTGPDGAAVTCSHLRMLGPLDDTALAKQYARAAVFVSAARYEPFGLAVLEAAQAGCALLLSDIPTFRELWDGAAVFVSPDDPRRIGACLHGLFQEPDRRAELSALAKRRAGTFTTARMADTMAGIHARLVANAQMAG